MDFKKSVLIFCNGDPASEERIRKLVPDTVRVVCADGGAQKALSVGYRPDIIVGDLDSLEGREKLSSRTEIVAVPDQSNTDFEKTLDLMLARGMDDFLVIAFSGGRIDQTLANIMIAFEYSDRCKIALADDHFVLIPVRRMLEEKLEIGTTVSIVAMTDRAVVTTEGLAYELSKAIMYRGGHGISNRSVTQTVRITVHEGGILLFVKDA